jgi:acetyl esterase
LLSYSGCIAAACDALHDEGLAYAERLKAAGVPVKYKCYAAMIRASFGIMPAVDDAMNAQRQVWAAFKQAFV